MKMQEIKEVKEILPLYFQNCVNKLEDHRNLGHFSAWSVGNCDYLVSSYWADEASPIFFSKSEKDNANNGLHPYFDLASLTKPLFLNALLRHEWKDDFQGFLLQSTQLFHWIKKDWNSDLIEFIEKNPELTFNSFLSHKSHFAPWIWCKFFISVRNSEFIKNDFVNFLLKQYKSSNKPVYSDLNYMFLAMLFESLFNIDTWENQLAKLNKMQSTNFFHVSISPEKSEFAVPSYPYLSLPSSHEISNEQKKFGVVHDTNANIFTMPPEQDRIVSGHAGFYGSIEDVYKGATFLKNTQPFMNEQDLKDRFLYGLDQCHLHQNGKNANGVGFGHLGYTGTSFWFKLQKTHEKMQDHFILLTNRTSNRKSELNIDMPRVCIVTDQKNKQHFYFFIYENKTETLTHDEFLNKSEQYFNEAQKVWNDSIILEYYNLSELRSTIGKEIW